MMSSELASNKVDLALCKVAQRCGNEHYCLTRRPLEITLIEPTHCRFLNEDLAPLHRSFGLGPDWGLLACEANVITN